MKTMLKSYPAPWEGRILLACKKCQKKLKSVDGFEALANLKKTVKRRNKHQPQDPLHVILIACMDVCPKNAVALCIPGPTEGRVCILRVEDDLDRLPRD